MDNSFLRYYDSGSSKAFVKKIENILTLLKTHDKVVSDSLYVAAQQQGNGNFLFEIEGNLFLVYTDGVEISWRRVK